MRGDNLRSSQQEVTLFAFDVDACEQECINQDCNLFSFNEATRQCRITITVPVTGFVADTNYDVYTRGRCTSRLLDISYL